MEPSNEPPGVRDQAARGLLLLLLCPALVWGCWNAGFIRYDDPMIFAWGGTASFVDAFRYHPEHQLYYPLTLLSWWLDKIVWAPVLSSGLGEQAWPAGIRITNVLLHALAAVCLWRTLRALRAPGLLAAFVTAAFALHPVACESVCWAVERKNVLAGVFAFAAFGQYVRAAERGARAQALALAFFAAALLAKPSALALFAVLVAWEALGRPAFVPSEESLPSGKVVLLRLLPWFALAAGFGVLSFVLHQNLVIPPPGGSVWTAMLTDAEILRRYLQNLAWPSGLSFFYGVTPIVSPFDPRFALNAAALAAAVGVTVGLCAPERRRLAVFGWLWFLGGMATSLNLISISFVMQDRYVYLSAPGAWLAVGLAVHGLFARMKMTSPAFARLAAGSIAAAALVWALASAARSRAFADSAQLFEDAAAKQPQSSYARIFFAQELEAQAGYLRGKGQTALADAFAGQAAAQYEAGVAAPDFERFLHQPAARMALGLLYYQGGKYAEAAAQAKASLQVPEWLPLSNQDRVRAERLAGMAAYKQGEYAEALLRFAEASEHAEAGERENLAILCGQTMLDWALELEAGGEAAHAAEMRADAASLLKKIEPGSAFFESAKKLLEGIPGKNRAP